MVSMSLALLSTRKGSHGGGVSLYNRAGTFAFCPAHSRFSPPLFPEVSVDMSFAGRPNRQIRPLDNGHYTIFSRYQLNNNTFNLFGFQPGAPSNQIVASNTERSIWFLEYIQSRGGYRVRHHPTANNVMDHMRENHTAVTWQLNGGDNQIWAIRDHGGANGLTFTPLSLPRGALTISSRAWRTPTSVRLQVTVEGAGNITPSRNQLWVATPITPGRRPGIRSLGAADEAGVETEGDEEQEEYNPEEPLDLDDELARSVNVDVEGADTAEVPFHVSSNKFNDGFCVLGPGRRAIAGRMASAAAVSQCMGECDAAPSTSTTRAFYTFPLSRYSIAILSFLTPACYLYEVPRTATRLRLSDISENRGLWDLLPRRQLSLPVEIDYASSMSTSADEAAKLKAEGNAFYVNKQYEEAIAKYSQAIEHDRNNAVLFSNRAACYQALKRFGKAVGDAHKATQLDEAFPKAWARLATAQAALSQSAEALASWRRALAALPTENPSPADLVQREQYQASLLALENKMREPSQSSALADDGADSSPGAIVLSIPEGGAPWDRAKQIEPEIKAQGITNSSVYTILDAYESFMLGQRNMCHLKPTKTRGDMTKFFGQLGAIEKMSNAVLTDSRAVHLTFSEWPKMYNLQARFEIGVRKAPDTAQPMEAFAAEARRLKDEGGWEAVRPAVATSVRCSIIFAFLESEAMHNMVKSVIVLDKILEILRWGRAEWPNASVAERGSIFTDTFIRGVRTMRLDRYIRALQSVGMQDALYSFSYEHVVEEADAMLEELRESQEEEGRQYKGFAIAFFVVPEAMALVAKGFYFMQAGIVLSSNEDTKDQGLFALRQAHEFYSKGAEKYPPDDERRLYFLAIALLALFRAETPLEKTLPCIAHIREARDAAKQIWEHMPSFKGSSARVDQYTEFEKEMLQEIEAGHVTMKDSRYPSWASIVAAEHLQF
ncbi:hypothetical protein EVG20_g6394 [Dentipellis fragilis]|uniref:Uncharacterized protein n=1 Tax=Dentipellis fragilis TaxID=205917 RepID=A0A4Y9YMA0_9AGAM|nr:hypothetical protein EVG20_g6394 [Dentipellis fragilis]